MTGIVPRNQVNQICNKLASAGRIVREPGPSGQLINRLPGVGTDQHVAAPLDAAPSGGSSAGQRAAEPVMLRILGEQPGVELKPRRLAHESGARVEIDGADADLTVLVERWAHQGVAKVAQKYKLVNDATKLSWIAGSLTPRPERLLLCVSDEQAVKHLRGRSWQGQAIAALGVEIVVVDLPDDLVDSIQQAQVRHFR